MVGDGGWVRKVWSPGSVYSLPTPYRSWPTHTLPPRVYGPYLFLPCGSEQSSPYNPTPISPLPVRPYGPSLGAQTTLTLLTHRSVITFPHYHTIPPPTAHHSLHSLWPACDSKVWLGS